MSLCEGVYRRGGVYWWRKKVRCGAPGTSRLIALSLYVREPSRARALAARLNARFYALSSEMLPEDVTLEKVRSILAEMIRDEINCRNESAFHAREGAKRLDLNPGEDLRASLIRDERAFAAVYELVAKYGQALKVDSALEDELKGMGFSQDSIWRIVDVLSVDLADFLRPGPYSYGPPLEYFEELLRRNGIRPRSEAVDFFWRQFLSVRAKILADTDSRYEKSLTGLDALYAQINKEMESNPARSAPRPVASNPPSAAPDDSGKFEAIVVDPSNTSSASSAPLSVTEAAPPPMPDSAEPPPTQIQVNEPPSATIAQSVKRIRSADEHPLMILAEQLLAEIVRDGRDSGTETRDVDVRHSRSLYRMFCKLLIEKEVFEVAAIRQIHLSDLKDLFDELPTSYGKNGRDETLKELRTRATTLPKKQCGIVAKTWNKHVSSLNRLLNYIGGKGLKIDTTLAPSKLRRKINKRARDVRSAMTDPDLTAIFNLSCFTGCRGWAKKEAHRYFEWVTSA